MSGQEGLNTGKPIMLENDSFRKINFLNEKKTRDTIEKLKEILYFLYSDSGKELKGGVDLTIPLFPGFLELEDPFFQPLSAANPSFCLILSGDKELPEQFTYIQDKFEKKDSFRYQNNESPGDLVEESKQFALTVNNGSQQMSELLEVAPISQILIGVRGGKNSEQQSLIKPTNIFFELPLQPREIISYEKEVYHPYIKDNRYYLNYLNFSKDYGGNKYYYSNQILKFAFVDLPKKFTTQETLAENVIFKICYENQLDAKSSSSRKDNEDKNEIDFLKGNGRRSLRAINFSKGVDGEGIFSKLNHHNIWKPDFFLPPLEEDEEEYDEEEKIGEMEEKLSKEEFEKSPSRKISFDIMSSALRKILEFLYQYEVRKRFYRYDTDTGYSDAEKEEKRKYLTDRKEHWREKSEEILQEFKKTELINIQELANIKEYFNERLKIYDLSLSNELTYKVHMKVSKFFSDLKMIIIRAGKKNEDKGEEFGCYISVWEVWKTVLNILEREIISFIDKDLSRNNSFFKLPPEITSEIFSYINISGFNSIVLLLKKEEDNFINDFNSLTLELLPFEGIKSYLSKNYMNYEEILFPDDNSYHSDFFSKKLEFFYPINSNIIMGGRTYGSSGEVKDRKNYPFCVENAARRFVYYVARFLIIKSLLESLDTFFPKLDFCQKFDVKKKFLGNENKITNDVLFSHFEFLLPENNGSKGRINQIVREIFPSATLKIETFQQLENGFIEKVPSLIGKGEIKKLVSEKNDSFFEAKLFKKITVETPLVIQDEIHYSGKESIRSAKTIFINCFKSNIFFTSKIVIHIIENVVLHEDEKEEKYLLDIFSTVDFDGNNFLHLLLMNNFLPSEHFLESEEKCKISDIDSIRCLHSTNENDQSLKYQKKIEASKEFVKLIVENKLQLIQMCLEKCPIKANLILDELNEKQQKPMSLTEEFFNSGKNLEKRNFSNHNLQKLIEKINLELELIKESYLQSVNQMIENFQTSSAIR